MDVLLAFSKSIEKASSIRHEQLVERLRVFSDYSPFRRPWPISTTKYCSMSLIKVFVCRYFPIPWSIIAPQH